MSTWPELVRLMSTAYVSSARGVWRGVEPPDDDDDDQGEARVDVRRFVLKAPNSWLVTDESGRLLRLCDGERVLLWRTPDEPPEEYATRNHAWSYSPDPFGLLRPLDATDWRPGEDYAEPTSAPSKGSLLGRACWRVDLAPPPNKTGVWSLWVDEVTGIRLRTENSVFGVLEEMLELELDVDVDDTEFAYAGPVDRSVQDSRDRDEEALHHFTRHPPPLPTVWPRGLGYSVMSGDARSGASVVRLDVAGAGALLARHRRTDPEWQPMWEGQVHRWVDESWQWTLVVLGEPLTDAELQAVVESIRPS